MLIHENCFISTISFNSFSQNNKFDSLNLALNNSKSDTTKIRLYHELYISTSNIRYINLGFKLSIKNNYQHGISVFYRDYGRQYFFSSKKDKALEYLNKAVKIAIKINDKRTLVSCYKYIGYIYAMNDPFLAQVYYVKSIKLARELNDFIGESYALSAIGNIYEGMIVKKGNFKIALSYYLKSLKIREKYGDDSEIAASLNETSRTYKFLGLQNQSSKLLFRALKIAECSSSIYDIQNLIYIYNSIGNDFVYRLHDYKKGLEYELKAYGLCLKIQDNNELMFDITKVIALTYSKLGLTNNANTFYEKSIKFGDSIKERTNKYDYNLSSIKHSLENKLNKQHVLLNKSEILKSRAEKRRQRTLRNTIIIGFSFWLFLIILILRSYNQNKKTNKVLNLKNQQIQANFSLIEAQNKIVEENNSKLKQLLIDKEILFKEVHHRVKNNLQIISSLINLQSNTITDEGVLDVLKQCQSRINTMAILHNKLYQTVDFTNVPIEDYLHQLIASISDSFKIDTCEVVFEIKADSEVVLNIDVAIPFGLILNELITNSYKHAFKNRDKGVIRISLNRLGDQKIHLIYRDNGVGLPSNYKELSTQSLGLELIEMLVLQLNGTVDIKNNDGAFFDIVFECSTENLN